MNISVLTLEISVAVLALVLLAMDLSLEKDQPRRNIGYLALCGLTGIFFFSFTRYGMNETFWNGLFSLDDYAVFFKQAFLIGAILVILFSLDTVDQLPHSRAEFYVLLLFAVIGMMVLSSANDLITLYVGIELMTFSFFILVGYVLTDARSTEAAIKYLILASAASAVMLYGMSLIFGLSGQMSYAAIAAAGLAASPALLVGGVLLLSGFAFKIAAPPFHMWAPDVYEGAPVPITAMLAMGSKAAGFAAMIRVFTNVFPSTGYPWPLLALLLSGGAMLVGNIVAIPQTNIKRMLAYSSVAQAGYILTGLVAGTAAGVKGMMFYLMIYVFANVGAFGVVAAVSRHRNGENIRDLAGLSRQAPVLAVAMTISLLSMAGIPPLAGFMGKFFLFSAVIDAGYLGIAVLGFVLSMVSVYYYLNVVKSMYLAEPADDRPFAVAGTLKFTVLFAMTATLAMGIYPGPLSHLAELAAKTVFH
ncbi:MAG: NADH-quinone oxidoreductase subunit N [Veillonellaceae bacterium]|nr:NADH-quinone oxidoreductase subunit N [Veillonellaceae bacterium]